MSQQWENGRRDERGALWFGVLLIVLGALFLAGNALNIDWERYGWPIFVILPGVIMFVLGLAIPNEAGLGLTIPGGIVASVGFLLLYQDTNGAWASWAYAWALVAPGSVGVSLFAYGVLHRKLDLVDAGLRTAAVGLGLFIGFGLFFENVVGLDGTGASNVMREALPFLAVSMGVIIVLVNLLPHPKAKEAEWQAGSDGWKQEGPTS